MGIKITISARRPVSAFISFADFLPSHTCSAGGIKMPIARFTINTCVASVAVIAFAQWLECFLDHLERGEILWHSVASAVRKWERALLSAQNVGRHKQERFLKLAEQ
jgi:hypothetical protein